MTDSGLSEFISYFGFGAMQTWLVLLILPCMWHLSGLGRVGHCCALHIWSCDALSAWRPQWI